MGCRCCRMIKSYIYDPSVAVDGRKSDSAGSSLYQPHHLSGDTLGPDPLSGHNKQKQGFHNLGYSKSNDGTLKLEADNNHVNRLHGGGPERELARQGSAAPCPDGRLYIIQPETPGPRWATQDRGPSQVPVYPSMQDYSTPSPYDHTDSRKSHHGDRGHRATGNGWDSSIGDRCRTRSGSLSADEVDEGVGGTPDPCDTGDEGSVRSVDIHTSTTSVSSDERGVAKTPDSTMESGICVMKSEDDEPEEEDEEAECDDAESVTDSMVAEALAALEAATAGEEDCECD